jgi:hypothetical protein
MKKYKFTILKHTLNNGSVYYICKVKILHTLVWTADGIYLFLSNYKDNEKYLNGYGGSYWNTETKFQSREGILDAINMYMSEREKEDDGKIKSIETEVIWR